MHDSREIRALGQANGIDIFGGNSLGVADFMNQVRIGGALGGDNPAEALRKGSIAIFSNSGNFTTTIATYLRMAGWGTTTLISSGKDVYIHFAAPEFAFALANDARSKAAVSVCRTWRLLRTRRHLHQAGDRLRGRAVEEQADAGRGPRGRDGGRRGRCRRQGTLVHGQVWRGRHLHARPPGLLRAWGDCDQHRAHPAALDAVMRENGARRDFAPEGSLALKPWFGSNQGLMLPPDLDIPVVQALAPYGQQIAQLNAQIGTVWPRQQMKDASGATYMDPRTQVTSVHGVTVLDAARSPFEANSVFRSAACGRGRKRPCAGECGRRRGGEPARPAGARRGRSGAGGGQFAQHCDGGGRRAAWAAPHGADPAHCAPDDRRLRTGGTCERRGRNLRRVPGGRCGLAWSGICRDVRPKGGGVAAGAEITRRDIGLPTLSESGRIAMPRPMRYWLRSAPRWPGDR